MSKGVLCSPRTDAQTDRQTHRQTDTKVNTEGTLSGFQDFSLQPIIKDRPKKKQLKTVSVSCLSVLCVFIIALCLFVIVFMLKLAKAQ